MPITKALGWMVLAGALLGICRPVPAQEPDWQRPDRAGLVSADSATSRLWSTSTLGGKHFWSDELVFHGWRIQRNVLSDHYRLLDDRNVRQAWGSLEQCRERLEELKVEQALPPLGPRVVLLLHGLCRTRQAMDPLGRYLEHNSQYTVLNVSYASTQGQVEDHAASLARVIEHLDGVQEINFVAHSLGNLVIRHYLADRQAAGRPAAARLGRIVMLAPPNKGAQMAVKFQDNKLFETVWGASGQQLAHWERLADRLATPDCQFGIIAGGSPQQTGRNPLLPGDDDMVLSVEETRLPGAHDFLVVQVHHGAIMRHPLVHRSTLRFLQHGHFVDESRRQPLPVEDGAVADGSP